MAPKVPIWWLDVDREDGLVSTISITDDRGRHIAAIMGPGVDTPDKAHELPTEEEAVQYARKFVWACGAKPKVKK